MKTYFIMNKVKKKKKENVFKANVGGFKDVYIFMYNIQRGGKSSILVNVKKFSFFTIYRQISIYFLKPRLKIL